MDATSKALCKGGRRMRLIDAEALEKAMYHEAFEKDSDMQKWDSGCWIRYKMFENVIAVAQTVDTIVIPKGATNGDMIMAIFGFEPRKNTCILPKDYCNGNPAECDGCKFNDWWNAPYEGGKEE